MAASLVMKADKEAQLGPRGRAVLGADGEPLPPVWIPREIIGCDLVARGDATSSLLGATDEEEHAAAIRRNWERTKAMVDDLEERATRSRIAAMFARHEANQ